MQTQDVVRWNIFPFPLPVVLCMVTVNVYDPSNGLFVFITSDEIIASICIISIDEISACIYAFIVWQRNHLFTPYYAVIHAWCLSWKWTNLFTPDRMTLDANIFIWWYCSSDAFKKGDFIYFIHLVWLCHIENGHIINVLK